MTATEGSTNGPPPTPDTDAAGTPSPVAPRPAAPSPVGWGARLADGTLSVLAIGGSLCIALVLAAVVFHVSIIMFKTGSMTPTIPAGSIALVREVPADSVRVGDVVTVDRPGALPVTHRVTKVETDAAATASPNAHARTLTLRGDANRDEDPAPYTVATVRIVLASVPGIAPLVARASDPVVLGATTLVMTAIVTWAFWPRRRRRRSETGGSDPVRGVAHQSATRRSRREVRAGREGHLRSGAGLLALALAVTLPLAPRPADTLASWTDPNRASGAYTARTIPGATLTSCAASNVVVFGGRIVITWTLPAGYALSDIQYRYSSTGNTADLQTLSASGSLTTTGPVSNVYTTTFQGALLSNVLGGSVLFGLRTLDSTSTWTSTDKLARATLPMLVGTGTCTIL